ncbi:DUF2851 family protein [Aestuariivivens sediminis]|uniref:DUF2851 family protein n=1 Tax=Aestuariivivens sediminis TaxID=2913557 RepID=UPI001F56FFC2|nr:DUF2851 family protein [Aestuariivivens sediminis]
MKEDFLHYLWKYKKFGSSTLKTAEGESIIIRSAGQTNHNAGPDFFNAQLQIGEQLWIGNVEIHLKSSDWYFHSHEKDKSYDNVILHVVWEHDTDVFRSDNSVLPTIVLKDYIPKNILTNYEELYSKRNHWINCESNFSDISDLLIDNWLERLYLERLERKSEAIRFLLRDLKNDWEEVLFKMLTKNFGLNINGEAFLSMANATPFSIVRKTQSNLQMLEALFFGQSGLLEDTHENGYYKNLVLDYQFLKQKFALDNINIMPVQFFRLRPMNFPTIRLSQLSSLYHKHQNLFSKIMDAQTLEAYYELFKVSTTSFWENHYTFFKESKASVKFVSKAFIHLLLINTILPLKFCYAKHKGEPVEHEVLYIISNIESETNGIVNAFNNLKPLSKSALHSQALIQLKTEYCDKHKCLQCAIGSKLLSR